MQKSILLAAIQKEIHRHDFSYFVDEPPAVAQGGKGVVVAGCPGVQEENQHDESISGPPVERSDAGID